MTEYMVNLWGGAWNENANPSIEKDLGIKKGPYYFETEDELNRFIDLISQPKYKKQGMMIDKHVGELTHKRPVFVGVFEYQGKQFMLREKFVHEYPAESAEFMFLQGNYSCDCNRSRFIRRQWGEDAMPELDCGCEIKLLDYHIEWEE